MKNCCAEHGGLDDYFRYLQRIDREEFGEKNSPKRKPSRSKSKSSASARGTAMKKVRTDPVVDRVRKVREKLYEQFGSMDALFDHFQEMDRQLANNVITLKAVTGRDGRRKTAKAPKGKAGVSA